MAKIWDPSDGETLPGVDPELDHLRKFARRFGDLMDDMELFIETVDDRPEKTWTLSQDILADLWEFWESWCAGEYRGPKDF